MNNEREVLEQLENSWMPSRGLELKREKECKYATANGNKPADAAYLAVRRHLRFIRNGTWVSRTT
jgi:hypothetical protein